MTYTNFDPDIETEILTKVPTEWEAQLIANKLTDNRIKVSLEGTQTASFQAEAPGEVSVVVRKDDLPEARKILEEYRKNKEEGEEEE